MTDVEVARYALRTFDLHPDFRDLFIQGYDIDILSPSREVLSSRVEHYFLGPLGRHFGMDHIWRDGTCVAECLRGEYGIGRWEARRGAVLPAPPGHKSPHMACTCGIYGALDLACLERQYRHETRMITAVIAAEGRTIIGTRGLRTEYARVVAWKGGSTYAEIATRQFRDAKRFTDMLDMLNAYHLPVDAGLGGGDGTWAPRWWA